MTGEAPLLRALETTDQDFLNHMAYEALRGSFKIVPPFGDETVMRAVNVNSYGWGKKGDTGLVAEDQGGEPRGAAWYRVFPERFPTLDEGRSYTPVVTIAVEQEARGRGFGQALLKGLLERAADDGIPRLNLSVAEHNEAARHVYDLMGFTEVKRGMKEHRHTTYFGSELVPAIKMTVQIAQAE